MEMKSADELEEQPALNVVSTAVLIVSAAFLSGGFYYGLNKQKKALEKEEKDVHKPLSQRIRLKPIDATPFQRQLALRKPLAPSIAAWKALLGVTLVSVIGCGVVAGGAALVFKVTNMTEFQKQLQRSSKKDEIIPLDRNKVDGIKSNRSAVIVDPAN